MSIPGPETPVSVLERTIATFDFGGLNYSPFKERDWPSIETLDPGNLIGDRDAVSKAATRLAIAMINGLEEHVGLGYGRTIAAHPDSDIIVLKKDPTIELGEKVFALFINFIIDPEIDDLPGK